MDEHISQETPQLETLHLRLSRRRAIGLGSATAAGTAISLVLSACGGSASTPASGQSSSAGNTGSGATPSPMGSGQAKIQAGGELKFALSSDPPNLDPHVDTGTASRAVKIQIYNGLARYWSDSNIQPDLAESWDISSDGLQYTFHLRAATFHDGTPLTSADVQASIQRIQDPKTGATRGAEISVIKEVTTEDDRTVIFKLDKPDAALLSYLALPEAAILSKKFLDGGGNPNTTMLGTGPFKFISREPGVRIEVQKNDKYFRSGIPYLDKITFTPYPNEDTRVAAIREGDVDIAEYIPWKDMAAIDKSSDLKLLVSKASSFMYIIYNVARQPFDNVKVRHALGYAFNRQAIVDAAFFGHGDVITGGLINKGSWAYSPGIEDTFTYDPNKAKQLLKDAGAGADLSVRLMSTSQYGMHQSTGEVCQKNLQDIGVNSKLDLFDWQTEVQKHTQNDYQFRIQGGPPGVLDPDFFTTFLDSQAKNQNKDGFADEQLDQLLNQGRSTLDQAKRKEIYNNLQKRMLEISPLTLLCWRDDGYAIKQTVQGFEAFPSAIVFLSPYTLQQVSLRKP